MRMLIQVYKRYLLVQRIDHTIRLCSLTRPPLNHITPPQLKLSGLTLYLYQVQHKHLDVDVFVYIFYRAVYEARF